MQQNLAWNLFKINIQDTRIADFIVDFEQIFHAALMFPLLTLNKQIMVGNVPS